MANVVDEVDEGDEEDEGDVAEEGEGAISLALKSSQKLTQSIKERLLPSRK